MAIDTPTGPYQPGDKVRVLVDEPYSTELSKDAVVTVVELAVKLESDGSEIPVVMVSTDDGHRWLGLDVIEPVALPSYAPAEPDEIIDARLRALLEGDSDLLTFFSDADTALGAEDQKLSDAMAGDLDDEDDEDDEHSSATGWDQPGPGNNFSVTDFYGDELEIHYAEQDCPNHGREGAFFFQINGDSTVMVPSLYIHRVIGWLINRHRFSQRDETA